MRSDRTEIKLDKFKVERRKVKEDTTSTVTTDMAMLSRPDL